jgi:general secretion pathway protein C
LFSLGKPMNPRAIVAISLALVVLPGPVRGQQPAESLPAPVRGQQRTEPLPASALPLQLVGVVKDTTTPSRSAALIHCSDPEGRHGARLFAIGERACDVAEITEIREQEVVIRNLLTNRLELLTLPKAGTRSAQPADRAANEVPPEAKAEAPAPRVEASSPDEVDVELRKDVLDHYLADVPGVLDSALATPRYASGGTGPQTIEGYEITRIRTGGIVDQLGLRDGDVIVEVNGQKLDSLAAVMGLFSRAQGLSGAKMMVLRGGRRVTFVYTVK